MTILRQLLLIADDLQRQNIEIILSPTINPRQLKQDIANTYPTFFNNHRSSNILQYRNNQSSTPSRSVDIVFTVFSLSYPSSGLYSIKGFPLVPYSFLLLQKLRAWDDAHKRSSNASNVNLASTLAGELITMLQTFRRRGKDLRHDPNFDRRLQKTSADRVERFFAVHPNYRKEWHLMGFLKNHTEASKANVGPPLSQHPPLPQHHNGTVSTPRTTTNAHTTTSQGPVQTKMKDPKPAQRPGRLSYMKIRQLAALTTVAILRDLGLPCAIFGSMACKLYGSQRIPNVCIALAFLNLKISSCVNRTSTFSSFRHPTA